MIARQSVPPVGTVYLVGAGPGDPGLITVRGRRILETADVVVYDRLIGDELLQLCRPDAERVYVGKAAGAHAMKQGDIEALLVDRACKGKSVCRLKGGDPFVFGRGGEEALHCLAAGVPFEVVPGVTSAVAAPACAGIPVTHRDIAASFAVVTGHTSATDAPAPLPSADTLVFLMGLGALPRIVKQLRHAGRAADTPAAAIRWGSTPRQEVVTGTIATIEAAVARAGLQAPALVVVGEVVRLREQLQWFDNRPLFGQRIVVTRAREQASGLVQALREKGAAVVECPTIRIEEVEVAPQLDEAMRHLSRYAWVVFSSANGVSLFWKGLRRHGLDARALGSSQLAAIGPATASALEAHGLVADYVPATSISEEVAAGLIECGAGMGAVLLPRAEQGREVLSRMLRDAGAMVTEAPCYRTVPDTNNAAAVREQLANGKVDWITFTSSSTVTNFLEAIGIDHVQPAGRVRFACLGPITARTLEEQGLRADLVAQESSIYSLIQGLIENNA